MTTLLSRPDDVAMPSASFIAMATTADCAVPAPPRKARVLRYSLQSVFGAPTNIVLYALLLHFTTLSAAWATVAAALVVIIPNFAISKYWVWKAASRDRLRREVSIYVGLTATSLAFATLVGTRLESLGASTFVLVLGNFSAFTLMWVVRFLILDRFAFLPTHRYAPSH